MNSRSLGENEYKSKFCVALALTSSSGADWDFEFVIEITSRYK